MKIIICDDSIEDLIKIEKLLQKFLESLEDTDVMVEKFTNPSRLYDKISQKELADIYILDMLMKEKTGIDIGSQLRKISNKNVILYITSSDDFALDAYRVHAARYLLKPVREEDFLRPWIMPFPAGRKKGIFFMKLEPKTALLPYPIPELNILKMYPECWKFIWQTGNVSKAFLSENLLMQRSGNF